MINGCIMFAADQGDRILIGATFGVEDLAYLCGRRNRHVWPWSFHFEGDWCAIFPNPFGSAIRSPKNCKWRYELIGLFTAMMSMCLAVPLILFGERIVPSYLDRITMLPRYLIAWLAIAAECHGPEVIS